MSGSRSRKQWSRWAVGLLALAVGCGPVEEPQQAAVQVEATAQVQQATTVTTTYTLTWPSNLTATGDVCRFGDTSQGHQVATNTRASGRLEESLTLTGLAGRRITSLRLNGSSTQFKYDDVMLLAYNNHLVMASDRRVAQYSASPASLGTSPVLYTWSKVLNGLIDNQNIQSPWCSSGATACTVPRTETTGSMDVNIPSFLAVDQAAYPSAPDSRTFRLVTIGDNDTSLDCRHGPVSLTVTVTHEPITSCTFTSQSASIHAGSLATSPLYGTGPFGFTWSTSTGAITNGFFIQTVTPTYAANLPTGAGPYYNVASSGTRSANNALSMAFTRANPNTYSFSFSGSLSSDNTRVTGLMDGGYFAATGSVSCTSSLPRSCKDLLERAPGTPTGYYTIDPDGSGALPPFSVYCDMQRDGGGWTLAMVSSDDNQNTWTWNRRTLMTTDTTLVGNVTQHQRDFKSPALHQLLFRDLLFIHAPSNVWAAYRNVGPGTNSAASFMASIADPVCSLSLAGNGYPLSAGTLTQSGLLCDTDLYFHLGDFDGYGDESYCRRVDYSQDTTYGPVWNIGNNGGCPFDDSGAASFGPNKFPGYEGNEYSFNGFGFALGLNTGAAGTARNHIHMYVR